MMSDIKEKKDESSSDEEKEELRARRMASCNSDELDGDLDLSDNEDEAKKFRS